MKVQRKRARFRCAAEFFMIIKPSGATDPVLSLVIERQCPHHGEQTQAWAQRSVHKAGLTADGDGLKLSKNRDLIRIYEK
jgi:hypothetical protein